MKQNGERSENGTRKPAEKQLVLLLLGLGAFQIIAALLALLLWLAGVSWQSHLVAIATVSVLLTTSVIFFIKSTRS